MTAVGGGGSRSAGPGCGRGTSPQQFRWMSASDTEKGLARTSRDDIGSSLPPTGYHSLPRAENSRSQDIADLGMI
ncbi:uncharacterized protein ACO6RY_16140 [Pungitius sinensis]